MERVRMMLIPVILCEKLFAVVVGSQAVLFVHAQSDCVVSWDRLLCCLAFLDWPRAVALSRDWFLCCLCFAGLASNLQGLPSWLQF